MFNEALKNINATKIISDSSSRNKRDRCCVTNQFKIFQLFQNFLPNIMQAAEVVDLQYAMHFGIPVYSIQ